MKTIYIERYNKMHLIKKESPTHHDTAKQDIPTMVRLSPEIPNYEPHCIDPHYQRDPYWNDEYHDQEKLEYKHIFNKPPEQIEGDEIIMDSHVSGKLSYALIGLWTDSP